MFHDVPLKWHGQDSPALEKSWKDNTCLLKSPADQKKKVRYLLSFGLLGFYILSSQNVASNKSPNVAYIANIYLFYLHPHTHYIIGHMRAVDVLG